MGRWWKWPLFLAILPLWILVFVIGMGLYIRDKNSPSYLFLDESSERVANFFGR